MNTPRYTAAEVDRPRATARLHVCAMAKAELQVVPKPHSCTLVGGRVGRGYLDRISPGVVPSKAYGYAGRVGRGYGFRLDLQGSSTSKRKTRKCYDRSA
eukprot:3122025-Prymnesium_polylepis.1